MHEKIALNARSLNETHAKYVDKLYVKDLVKDDVKVAKVIRVLKDPNDFHSSDINSNHILKSRHGSGQNIDLARIQDEDIPEVKRFMRIHNHKYGDPIKEPQYQHIPVGFYIEEKIRDVYHGISSHAATFMIRCIRGRPICIGIKLNKSAGSSNYLYTPNWKQLTNITPELDPPKDLRVMLNTAAKLSKQFRFVRMDFYQGMDGVYLSEFTFSPSGGRKVFSDQIERWMSQFWDY